MSEEKAPATVYDRRRVRMQLTVHPRTEARLLELAERFTSNKGRIVDKLVECLATAYAEKRVHCIHGPACKVDLTNLPEVF